jgi:hypothetical protein
VSSRPEFYAVLGLMMGAAPDDVKRAYRTLARQFHPDANPGDPHAGERFSMLHEAYHVLSTPELRAAYDQTLRALHPELGIVPPASGPGGAPAGGWSTPAPAVARGGPTRPQSQPPDEPALTLHCVPGLAALAPSSERRVFYVLSDVRVAAPPIHAAARVPAALALVIDCGSSMRGARLDAIRSAVGGLLTRLGPDDRVIVVGFDDRAEALADGAPGEVRGALDQPLDHLAGQGAADMAAGLSVALERLAARVGRQRVSGLLVVTWGRVEEDERCLRLARRARETGVALTALGMGTEWNRDLLDQLAVISGGAADYLDRPDNLGAIAADWVTGLRASVARDLRLSFEPAPGVATARATRIAPAIAELFTQPIAAGDGAPQDAAAQVNLGMVADHTGHDGPTVIWQLMLYPGMLALRDGSVRLGRLVADYDAPGSATASPERIKLDVTVPPASAGAELSLVPPVRSALELITAYRLQVQADALICAGRTDEAAIRLSTSALRLRGAGRHDLAMATQRAADALASGGGTESVLADVLRIRYDTKHLGYGGRRHHFG